MNEQVDLSVVVPVWNEQESLAPLVDAVREALGDSYRWELLLVDDGSSDATASIAAALAASDDRIRPVRLARNYGQTPAMQAGFDSSRGTVVVGMDGDLQNDPRDILALVNKLNEGYDLVAGYRQHRRDNPITRKVPSWIANQLIARMTGLPIRDNGCSLKAYRRDLLDRLHLYSDMHRFIPAVAAATAGARIAEVPVRHHARRFGRSKYGLSRVLKVLADLLVIKMIRSFRDRPLVMFAFAAMFAALVGGITAASLIVCAASEPGFCAADTTLVIPTVALLWLGFAYYLIILGLIAQSLLQQSFVSRPSAFPIVREVFSRSS
jgi:glycosyltransferase involved in cell wall biosynthesis